MTMELLGVPRRPITITTHHYFPMQNRLKMRSNKSSV